ncbi:MAG: UbiX family flavin prenyltransferase [Planctomycetota bacterium]
MSATPNDRNIIVAISGASGSRIGLRLIEVLTALDYRPHVILSRGGRQVLAREAGIARVEDLRFDESRVTLHGEQNVGAAPASGTFPALGMIIAPCSMGTVARIASGSSSNLVERAADVTLKERRRLVIVPRESPLSVVHLENLLRLARQGARIVPALLALYAGGRTAEDFIDHIVTKALDGFGIDAGLIERWKG